MTKVQAIKQHIALREQFYERKYNPVHYAFGFARCMLYSRATFDSSCKGLQQLIDVYGTVSVLCAKLSAKP